MERCKRYCTNLEHFLKYFFLNGLKWVKIGITLRMSQYEVVHLLCPRPCCRLALMAMSVSGLTTDRSCCYHVMFLTRLHIHAIKIQPQLFRASETSNNWALEITLHIAFTRVLHNTLTSLDVSALVCH